MNYCSNCAQKVIKKIPDGDNRHRFVCEACGQIYYQNPKIITGCLPLYGDSVLLCRRAIAPRAGYWTLPAGFLENGETASAGAIRETLEEANAQVRLSHLYTLFNLPHISQVYMFYIGELVDLNFYPGQESTETRLFREPEIPWKELAFPVITLTLKKYFQNREKNSYPFTEEDVQTGMVGEAGTPLSNKSSVLRKT
ncbi:NUDIX hydrolase [Gammaproteobacteria bacterium]|nr:NUDIX hydrolase [Gammaproteobacteria bacterium]